MPLADVTDITDLAVAKVRELELADVGGGGVGGGVGGGRCVGRAQNFSV